MFNENKKIVITFNGEIYNYQDLRKDLIEKGHVFANNSDTEVLIHSYEEYGKDMLNKLRGMFAFVIWDSEKETLLEQETSSESSLSTTQLQTAT